MNGRGQREVLSGALGLGDEGGELGAVRLLTHVRVSSQDEPRYISESRRKQGKI